MHQLWEEEKHKVVTGPQYSLKYRNSTSQVSVWSVLTVKSDKSKIKENTEQSHLWIQILKNPKQDSSKSNPAKYLNTNPSPERCGSVGWALSYEAKGHQFDSQS